MTMTDAHDASDKTELGRRTISESSDRAARWDQDQDGDDSSGPSLRRSSSRDGAPVPSDNDKILGVNIGQLSRTAQFVVASGGVFFCYIMSGYFQEHLLQKLGIKAFTWMLTLMEFGFLSLFSVVEGLVRRSFGRKVPFRTYLYLALLKVVTIYLSNTSLSYLNYPTQVVFKCCEPIPMLIAGIIIQRKRYNWEELSACVCMSIGLVFFTMTDMTLSTSFSYIGVLCVTIAICTDAVVGNLQEKTLRNNGSTIFEMVMYTYSIGFLYIVCGETVSGHYDSTLFVSVKYPWQTLGYGFMVSLANYVGINIILFLVRSFGALVASVVAACRKAVTIYLSFVFFAKPFTSQYAWSGCIVVIGVFIHIYTKNRNMFSYRRLKIAIKALSQNETDNRVFNV